MKGCFFPPSRCYMCVTPCGYNGRLCFSSDIGVSPLLSGTRGSGSLQTNVHVRWTSVAPHSAHRGNRRCRGRTINLQRIPQLTSVAHIWIILTLVTSHFLEDTNKTSAPRYTFLQWILSRKTKTALKNIDWKHKFQNVTSSFIWVER